MASFDPFSVKGKKWLEEHEVEDQFNSLENLGLSRTRFHSKSKMDINSDTDENMENEKDDKDGVNIGDDIECDNDDDNEDDNDSRCCCRCCCRWLC